jgi:hypothetical protein
MKVSFPSVDPNMTALAIQVVPDIHSFMVNLIKLSLGQPV